MRDIYPDLVERLKAAEQARQQVEQEYTAECREAEARYKGRLSGLDAEVGAIRSLIDIEARRKGQSREPIAAAAPSLPIKDFLVKKAKEAGPLSKSELRDIAVEAGYFQRGENPGRSTHALVMSLLRAGRLLASDGKYDVPPQSGGHSKSEDPAAAGSITR